MTTWNGANINSPLYADEVLSDSETPQEDSYEMSDSDGDYQTFDNWIARMDWKEKRRAFEFKRAIERMLGPAPDGDEF